jgi:hypothetical protein
MFYKIKKFIMSEQFTPKDIENSYSTMQDLNFYKRKYNKFLETSTLESVIIKYEEKT